MFYETAFKYGPAYCFSVTETVLRGGDIRKAIIWTKIPKALACVRRMFKEKALQAPKICRLERLPVDVLFEIFDHLDPVSSVCLKSTSRCFRRLINVDAAALDRCEKWLITCRFYSDIKDPGKLPSHPCALCKRKRKARDWYGSPGYPYPPRKVFEDLTFQSQQTRWDPVQRYCAYHKPHLEWIRPQPGLDAFADLNLWAQRQQLTCLHCHYDVSPSAKGETQCKNCGCRTCPHVYHPRFVKVGYVGSGNGFLDIDELRNHPSRPLSLAEHGLGP